MSVVSRNPEIMSGAPCFRGTRVPVAVVFDNLADGVPVEVILEEWPSLDRGDVFALLREAGALVEKHAA